jgi:site-specific recombinase XerD
LRWRTRFSIRTRYTESPASRNRRGFFQWATDHGVAVLEASRAHIELFRAWMEDRGLAASTIDRRLSTVCGFYRFAHIDGRIRSRLSSVHPHMRRAAFIMAALDAGVPLRDVQIAARHADPRTTTIYDRRRQNFDRHAAYVVVAFVAGS